ncbi:toxin-antitoxin system YwqK family antitoxin [Verrucomicrobiales bacterium]|nr:toxin-antitoxin system YwqK family antitoxin [Verrucomicrobiales bacterium]
MNPLHLLVLLVSLPLLLGGCGGEKQVVNFDLIEKREGIRYLKDSDAPYTGKVISLYDKGQKKFKGTYKNGKHHGLWVLWYNNGQKKAEGNYKDGGERDGLWAEWHDNGQKKWEGNYKDGKKYGIVTEWYKNGQKEEERTYKSDKREGLRVRWHENGQKATEGTYKDDKNEGLVVGWYEDGQKMFELIYKDGVEISGKTWYSKGEPGESWGEAKEAMKSIEPLMDLRTDTVKKFTDARRKAKKSIKKFLEGQEIVPDKERIENDDRIEVDERRRLLMSMPDEPYKFLKDLPEENLRVWLYAYDHYRKAKDSLSYVLSADQIISGKPQR